MPLGTSGFTSVRAQDTGRVSALASESVISLPGFPFPDHLQARQWTSKVTEGYPAPPRDSCFREHGLQVHKVPVRLR